MSSSACLLNSTSSACLNSTNVSALLTKSAIIGIAVGGFIFLLLIILCIICICCGCCACKNTFTQNGQKGVIYPHTFNEEPSVIMIQPRERFKPHYIPPHTQNPKPVPARRPEVNVTPQRPPQPRPISVRPISSYPPAGQIPQVVDPPFYELPNNPGPVKENPPPIYEPPSQVTDPPYYQFSYEQESVQEIPTTTYEPPAYNEFEPQPTNVVENVENFNYDQ